MRVLCGDAYRVCCGGCLESCESFVFFCVVVCTRFTWVFSGGRIMQDVRGQGPFVTEFCWVVDAKLQEWRWLGAWLLFPVCSSLTVLKGFEFRGGI